MARYETRLKDVVRAYKGLAKEKETLETSLKVITDAVNEEKESEKETTDTECEENTNTNPGETVINPGPRLAALSSSLAAVAAEKSQSEAKFLADKRKMKKEKDELVAELEKIKKSEEEIRTKYEEIKSKLIIEKHEREKEINNNKLMMQEMQKLLSDERIQREKLAEELLEANSKVTMLEDPSKSKQYEHQIRAMQLELESAKKQIARSEKQLKDQNITEQNIATLQMEIADMKRKHWDQLHSADTAREKAELRVLEVQSHQEKRVGNLESRLQELSESVGNYEKLRQQDQAAISCMRDEIDLLNSENLELARAATNSPPNETEETVPNLERAVEKILSLKSLLLESRSIEELEDIFRLPGQEDLASRCRDLQDKLDCMAEEKLSCPGKLEEFLTQNNRNHTVEISALKASNEDLISKLNSLKKRNTEQERDLNEKHLKILELKQQFEKERETSQCEERKRMTGLRLEVQEQRERCLALLEEKDLEIQKLRGQMEAAVEDSFYNTTSRENSKSPMSALPRKVSVDSCLDMGRQESSCGGPPLHYVQELCRKEVEIKELRSQQYQAETGLREIQLTMSAKEEKYQDRIEELEDCVRRLERMTTVEGASQEYLKNVVLNYMLSTDIGSKNHMLKAIGAVLRLTDKEVKRVMEHNQAWWWRQHRVAATQPNK